MSSGSESCEGWNVQRRAGYKCGERGVESVGGGRAAGEEYVHFDELVDGANDAQQLRHDDARDLLLRGSVLNIGAVENGFRAEWVARGRHIAGDGAIAHGHEELGVGANLFDL